MSGLGLTFLRRGGQAHPTAGSDYIRFADQAVFDILMSKGVSSDGVGITKDDAARVASIPYYWFCDNSNIHSFNEFVYFKSVKTIELTAFRNCKSLEEISFPPYVESIQPNAFLNCTSLRYANIANTYSLDFGSFRNCPLLDIDLSLTTIWSNTAVGGGIAIETGIVRVNAPMLTTMSTTQYTSHFQGCVRLEEVVNLGSITTIPDGNVNYSVFRGCQNLRKVTLPPSLSHLGAFTFNKCTTLAVVISEATTPPVCGTTPFANTNNTFIIYVPDASVEAYKAATGWNSFAARIKGISEYNG